MQSVAVRLIVERQRQRMAFVSATWWDLLGTFANAAGKQFTATMISVNGKQIPAGKDFDAATGKLKDGSLLLLDEKQANELTAKLREAEFRVTALKRSNRTRRVRIRRLLLARCNRKPTAKWASPRGGPCRPLKACMKTGTSPTCEPTRLTWRA